MKHNLPAVLLLISSFGPLSEARANLAVSVFAGPQCDAPAVEDGVGFDSSCSVQPLLGAALSFPGPGRWRFETEGQFARRSFRSEALVTDTSVRADFFELAFLSTWPIRESSSGFRVAVVLGPQLGILLRARRRFGDLDQDIADELRPMDLKAVAALRLSRRTGWGRLFVEGGLAWGLTNLDDTNQQQIHSRALVVKLGLIL